MHRIVSRQVKIKQDGERPFSGMYWCPYSCRGILDLDCVHDFTKFKTLFTHLKESHNLIIPGTVGAAPARKLSFDDGNLLSAVHFRIGMDRRAP